MSPLKAARRARFRLSAPILLRLPLYRRGLRVLAFEPIGRVAGPLVTLDGLNVRAGCDVLAHAFPPCLRARMISSCRILCGPRSAEAPPDKCLTVDCRLHPTDCRLHPTGATFQEACAKRILQIPDCL